MSALPTYLSTPLFVLVAVFRRSSRESIFYSLLPKPTYRLLLLGPNLCTSYVWLAVPVVALPVVIQGGDPPPFSMVLALVLSLLSSVAFHPFPLKDRVRALNCGINWNWINPRIVLCVLKVIILVNCRIREINKQTISECEWIRII